MNPKLDKSTVALTFKFDCDRFLRFRLATEDEVKSGVPDSQELKAKSRPGIELITAQGRAWEASCYDDVVREAPKRTSWVEGDFDVALGRKKYGAVTDLLSHLKKATPPSFIIEAQFDVPGTVGIGLDTLLKGGRLSAARGRPDLLWIQPYSADVPLIKAAGPHCKFIIHIVDVKLAAEPSLRHFVEVTFYALGLQAWLDQHDDHLKGRFAVAAEGRVWPGTHDANSFRAQVAKLRSEGASDPLSAALAAVTHAVPYEVYKPRLQQFIDVRLPSVLKQQPFEAAWHVNRRCQLCEFLDGCVAQAKSPSVDHLAQVEQLTAGHAQILSAVGIQTVGKLKEAMERKTEAWDSACAESHALRSLEPALRAQVQALSAKTVEPIAGRRTVAMPRFAHLNIYLTAHFDPGTGITFAFGARKVHFKRAGEPPAVDEVILPVDSIDAPGNLMSPKAEGERLAELCERINGWLGNLDEANKVADKKDKQSAHFYVWDQLEATQLARVVSRHLANDAVMKQASFLLRVFPPEMELRNADDLASQPITVVRPVLSRLIALPVPFAFTLMEARNLLDPFIKDGKQIPIQHPFGYATPMSDQIPLERAYEVWQDRPMLRKFSATEPYEKWPKNSREEIRDGIKAAAARHLHALEAVVQALHKEKYRDKLLLRKEPFSLKPPPQMRLPENSVMVYTLEQLSSVAAELESRQVLAMPVDEREALFHSIRGIVPATASEATRRLEQQVSNDQRYSADLAGDKSLLVFEFSSNSRDTRLRDGAFMVVLRNEERDEQLDLKWYRAAGFETYEGAVSKGYTRKDKYVQYQSLKSLLQVTLARIETMQSPPLLAIIFEREALDIARRSGILDFSKPMVLDPIHRDYHTKLIEDVVRRIGGKKK